MKANLVGKNWSFDLLKKVDDQYKKMENIQSNVMKSCTNNRHFEKMEAKNLRTFHFET